MRNAVALVLIAVSVLLAWSQATPSAPLERGLLLGTAFRAGNLAVWPVLAGEVPEIGPFRTLEAAQSLGELGIHERKEAEVATLVIENRGNTPILACAGTIFAGGKQDRQLGEDTVVAAHSTVPVKTYCVEENRWSGGRTFMVVGAKAKRTIRAAGQYDGDQSGVWRGVADARAPMGLEPGSYRAVANAGPKRATKVAAHLRAQEGNLVGYAYAINGKLMGMRTFAHPALFEPRLDAMVHAICVESEQSETVPNPAAVSEELQRMAIYLRMASDAYDDGEYSIAEVQAERVLALDSENAPAKELLRIAKESRYIEDGEVRTRFNDEWRAVMAQLEGVDCRGPLAALDDQVGVFGDTGAPHEYRGRVENLFDFMLGFESGVGVETRGLGSGEVITLVRSAYEPPGKTIETNGGNRNHYRRTVTGNHATCLIRGKDGRWIPLTRDWTAR